MYCQTDGKDIKTFAKCETCSAYLCVVKEKIISSNMIQMSKCLKYELKGDRKVFITIVFSFIVAFASF